MDQYRIRLTPAQSSALEASGVFEAPDGAGEEAVSDASGGQYLTFQPAKARYRAASAINQLANAEDDQALDPNRSPDQRVGDRGACTALTNLASKLWGCK